MTKLFLDVAFPTPGELILWTLQDYWQLILAALVIIAGGVALAVCLAKRKK